MDLMKKIVELKDIERKEYQKATNDRDRNYAHGALLAYKKIGQILENACAGETSERKQANEILPLVRCFKTYGEKIIKELGFELDHKYDHDHFHTNRYRKGLLMVEFTYEGFTLKTVDLTIDDTFCKPITYAELQALAPILGVIPE